MKLYYKCYEIRGERISFFIYPQHTRSSPHWLDEWWLQK